MALMIGSTRSSRNMCAERFTSRVVYHGEGPFWDVRKNRLLCMDVLAGCVIAVDTEGEIERFPVPTRATTVIRRRSESGFVIATERGVVLADEGLHDFQLLAEISVDPRIRTNDGGCDPLGALVIGTMSYDGEVGAGAVYRVTGDGRVETLHRPVSISNGVQWAADGGRVYYIDTPTKSVDMFDVDPVTGAWSDPRTHIRLDACHGVPDGMAIDEDGGLWVALWGGGAVNHYDSGGRLVETISVPGVSQISSCAFGSRDGKVLYITTSRQGLAEDYEPDAGAIFRVETSVRGARLSEFSG